MRRTLTLLAPIVLVLGPACSCSDGGIEQSHPTFQADEPVADFAQVCVGDTAEYVLPIRNAGPIPLNIARVTTADPSVQVVGFPERLEAAGLSAGMGEIVLRWSPGGEGDMTTDLVVESDDPNSPTTLHVIGHGDGGTRVDVRFLCEAPDGQTLERCPTYLGFSDTAVGASSDVPVVLSNEGCARLTVTDYYVTDEAGARLEDPNAVWAVSGPEPGFDFSQRSPQTLVPRFQPQQDGSFFGELHVVWEDGAAGTAPVDDRLSINGIGSELKLFFEPRSFSFSEAEQGSPQEQRFNVRNLGTLDGAITAIEMRSPTTEFTITPPDGEAPWAVDAQSEVAFSVSYEPSDIGSDRNVVMVRTSMGDFEVPVVGGAVPRLELSPADVLDFGAVTTGESETLQMTLRNGGKAPLVIQAVRFLDNPPTLDGGKAFSRGDLPAFPFEIAPGGERTFPVFFDDNPNVGWTGTPEPMDSEQAELVVKTNDPTFAEPPVGSGLEPGEASILLLTNTEANFGPERVIIVGSYYTLVDGQQVKMDCEATLCTVTENTTVTLDASYTDGMDPEGDVLSYDWAILQYGSNNLGSAEFSGAGETLKTVTIAPDYVGRWRFQLTATDPYGNSKTGTFEVSVEAL